MGDYGNFGSFMRPCFNSEIDYENALKKSEFYTKNNYFESYNNHVLAMEIIADCAKIFISKNYKKIGDWSGLNVFIKRGKNGKYNPIEYYNYIPYERTESEELKKSPMSEMLEEIDREDRERHNPAKTVSKVVFDPSDGDFSITINDNEHWFLDDETIVVIADYIEEQLKTNI